MQIGVYRPVSVGENDASFLSKLRVFASIQEYPPCLHSAFFASLTTGLEGRPIHSLPHLSGASANPKNFYRFQVKNHIVIPPKVCYSETKLEDVVRNFFFLPGNNGLEKGGL